MALLPNLWGALDAPTTATLGTSARLLAAGATGAVRADDADAGPVVAQAPRRIEAGGRVGGRQRLAWLGCGSRALFGIVVGAAVGRGRRSFLGRPGRPLADAAAPVSGEDAHARAVGAEASAGVEGCLGLWHGAPNSSASSGGSAAELTSRGRSPRAGASLR